MGIKEFFGRLFHKEGDIELGAPKGKNHNSNQDGKQMVCVDCKTTFLFEPGEQKFYKMRGLTPPKRCPGCRSKRKHQKQRA